MSPSQPTLGSSLWEQIDPPVPSNAEFSALCVADLGATLTNLKAASSGACLEGGCENHRASRERSLAITKIQEAIMWLNEDLEQINNQNEG